MIIEMPKYKTPSELKGRVLYGGSLTLMTALVIGLSPYAEFSYLMALVIGGLAVWALEEYTGIVKATGVSLHVKSLHLANLSVFWLYLMFPAQPLSLAWGVFAGFLLLMLTHFLYQLELRSLMYSLGGIVYITLPMALLLYFSTALEFTSPFEKRWALIYLFGVSKVSDMAAMVTGRIFGRVKLAPHISPNKTIEGAIGGCLISGVLSAFLAYFAGFGASSSLAFFFWGMAGAILAVIAATGDLFESWLKRQAGVKDSGKIPGIGGILDVLDSLLFVIPLWVLGYLTWLK